MINLFQNKALYSALFALIFCVLIVPLTESIWFDLANLSRTNLVYASIIKIVFSVCIGFLFWFILRFIEKIRNKDTFYMSWLKYSLLYGLLLVIVFILIFPGIWMWDEFFILEPSKVYRVASWQHIFTQIQYILSIYIIPSSTGITIIQFCIISVIVGYSIATIQRLFSRGRLWLLAWVPFLLFPVLFSNFYTLRLHIYGYILLLLVVKLLAVYTDKKPAIPQYARFLGFVVIVTLLAFWRSEGIIYLAVLPFIAYRLRIFYKKELYKTITTLVVSLFIIAIGFLATKYTESPRYKITALINPLSTLIHEDLRGDQIEDAWNDVDTVLNLSILRKYPSYTEIPANWVANKEPLLREGFENNLDRYYKGAQYIIIQNLDIFLKYRIKTFMATNAIEKGTYGSYTGNFTPFSTSECEYLNDSQCETLRTFDRSNKFNRSFNPQLREKTLNIILMTGDFSFLQIMRGIIWNVLPVIVGLIVLAVHALWKRRYIWLLPTGLLLLHALLVFSTAPANYFMYYFPVYLVGLVLIIMYLLNQLNKKPPAQQPSKRRKS